MKQFPQPYCSTVPQVLVKTVLVSINLGYNFPLSSWPCVWCSVPPQLCEVQAATHCPLSNTSILICLCGNEQLQFF